MKKITVYGELNLENNQINDVTFELISKAKKLAVEAKKLKQDINYQIEAVFIASYLVDDEIKKAYKSGADRVVLIKDSVFDIFYSTIYANAFLEYYKNNPADVILFPATLKGRSVAPRVTAQLDTGLVADCTEAEFIIKNEEILFAPTRPTFGSELMATILSKKAPFCATIRPNIFKKEFIYSDNGEFVEYIPASYYEERIKLVRSILDKNENTVDFSNANVVLCGGYGLYGDKSDEYFIKLKKLSKITDSKFGATRKVVDFNLVDSKYQIGQTGSNVEAKLYIAFGVSGAIQHIQGMKNSKTIVAINTDENAEIFKYSDYKIVADAKKVIDDLLNYFNIK